MYYPSIEKFTSGVDKVCTMATEPEAEDNYKWHVQEKIDGSNFSFKYHRDKEGLRTLPHTLQFTCGSKPLVQTNDMFVKTCTVLNELSPIFNKWYVYHGEAVRCTKHNVAKYMRVPRHYFVCFDIYDNEHKQWLGLDELEAECLRCDIECVKTIYVNCDNSTQPSVIMKNIIEQINKGNIISQLGGKPEGIVFKHPRLYSKGSYSAVKRKMVTAEFKESAHTKQVKINNSADDFLAQLGLCFATGPRFAKANQHLEERGDLCAQPATNRRLIIKELDADFDKEYKAEIMLYLWQELGHIIKNNARIGITEWMDIHMPLDNTKSDLSGIGEAGQESSDVTD